MTTTFTSHPGTLAEDRGLTVDSLNVRDAVIGDGLMLSQDEQHRWVLHSLEGGRAQLLGSFASVAQALSMLDALELEELDGLAA